MKGNAHKEKVEAKDEAQASETHYGVLCEAKVWHTYFSALFRLLICFSTEVFLLDKDNVSKVLKFIFDEKFQFFCLMR